MNYKNRKKVSAFSFTPTIPPLSKKEKKELEMRIFVAICQSAVLK